MFLTPNDLFSWNNKYSKYTVILSHIYYNELIPYSPAMHVNTHSVHAGILKPRGSRLRRPLFVFSSHCESRLPSLYAWS